jgi:aspartate kinase
MALIVQKFGGTSVGSVERIRNVARRVAKWKEAGHDLVVVPSAMAGETDRLIGLARGSRRYPIRASSTWSPPPASRSPSDCWRWR